VLETQHHVVSITDDDHVASFAAMPATATMARMIARAAAERAPPRARNVHESVSRLLAGRD